MGIPGLGFIKDKIKNKVIKEVSKEAEKEVVRIVPRSYRTTGHGIGLILVAIANVIRILLDDDPSTVVDWGLSVAMFQQGMGLISARDEKAHKEKE